MKLAQTTVQRGGWYNERPWLSGDDLRAAERRLFRRYPVLSAFAAGVLCTLLVVSMTHASAPRPAQEPAPVPDRMGFEHGGRVPAPSVTPGLAPAPGWSPVTPSLADDRDAARVGGDSPGPQALRGTASWYATDGLIAAAGPALRVGDWRGSRVTVCAERCVTVRLTDWCQCYRGTSRERLIDLSDDAFRRLAPLSVGVVRVRVVGAIALPETDAP